MRMAFVDYGDRGVEWWLVTGADNTGRLSGVCVTGLVNANALYGKRNYLYGLYGATVVEEDDLPDEALAALAKWGLTNGAS